MCVSVIRTYEAQHPGPLCGPQSQSEEASPGAGRESRPFAKRKLDQARGELVIRRSKTEQCALTLCPFCVAFGRIDRSRQQRSTVRCYTQVS